VHGRKCRLPYIEKLESDVAHEPTDGGTVKVRNVIWQPEIIRMIGQPEPKREFVISDALGRIER
jgi:hypothetical protein